MTRDDVLLSLFNRDTNANAKDVQQFTWEGFVSHLSEPLPSDVPKRGLELWSPATFLYNYRNKDNVKQVCLLTLDVDEDPIPSAATLRETFEGIRTFIHSSSRATAQQPRWRCAIALSRPVSAEEYERIWRAFTACLPFRVGKQSKDASRAWYMPRRGPDGYYEALQTDGLPLDVDLLLAEVLPEPIASPVETSTDPSKARAAQLAAAATLLGTAWPEKGRHSAQLALAGALYHANWEQEAAFEFLCAVCKAAGNEDRSKRRSTIANTWARGERGQEVTGWSTLKSHVDSSIVDKAVDLLKRDDFKTLAGAIAASTEENPKNSESLANSPLTFEFGAWDEEPPPVEFLVDKLLPKECVAMWFGRADSLKTWLVYSLAISLASGTPFLGAYPCKQVKVGIIDYETGKNNVRRRLYMLRAGKNPNLGTVSFTSLKPNQREFWVELVRWGFDVVFIDSLRRANGGANENDSGEAIVPLELAAEFSEITGCAVVFIHHAKKTTSDGKPDFRGSAAIEDQVDCAFVVQKNDVSATKKTVEVSCTKPGDMPTPEPFVAEIEFNDSARTATIRLGKPEIAVKDIEPSDVRIQQEIKLALQDGPFVKEDIKKRVKGTTRRVYDEIDVLKARGEIVKTNKGFALDDDDHRRERVYEQIRRHAHWTSEAKLARAAYVDTHFVEEMLLDGLICRRATGGEVGGFMVVHK